MAKGKMSVTTQCGLPQRHKDTENFGIALFLFLFVELKRTNEIFGFNYHSPKE